jgi:hypothetical protein
MVGGLEQAVGRAIGDELARRGLEAPSVERRLSLPGGALAALVAGRGVLEIGLLRRVLTYLDLDPSAFFAGLLADAGQRAVETPQLARQQVAGLLEQVRRALLEIDA